MTAGFWSRWLQAPLYLAYTAYTNTTLAVPAWQMNYVTQPQPVIDDVRWVFERRHRADQVAAARRKGHYMNPALLQSQFDALEPPRDALNIDVDEEPAALAERVLQGLALTLVARPGALGKLTIVLSQTFPGSGHATNGFAPEFRLLFAALVGFPAWRAQPPRASSAARPRAGSRRPFAAASGCPSWTSSWRWSAPACSTAQRRRREGVHRRARKVVGQPRAMPER
jgi:hypothetical protein